MKRLLSIVLPAVLLAAPSCTAVINDLAFFPDKKYTGKLPANASEVMLETPDGIKLQCLLFAHEVRSEKIVIYFHGNGGNLYHRIREAGKIFDMGPDIVISGYRGYGKSTGEPSEQGIYRDGECLFGYVRDRLGYSPDKIFIYGRSLGTTVAVYVAARYHPRGVILVTPLSSGKDLAGEMMPGCVSFFAGGSFSSISRINEVKCPVLFIHGTADRIVPYSHGLKLFNAFNGKKEMVTIKNGTHNELELTDPELYWGSVKTFLSQ